MDNTNKIILNKLFDLEKKIMMMDNRLMKLENKKEKTNFIKCKIKIISEEDKLFLDICNLDYNDIKKEKNKILLKKEIINLDNEFLLEFFSRNSIYGDYKIIKEYYLDNNFIIFDGEKYFYWDNNWKSDLDFLDIIIKNLQKTYCKIHKMNSSYEKYLLNQKHIFNFKNKTYINKLKNKILSYFD